jgi:NADP-dependent 3-hydroxy acid dehydrogenase YdfG
MSLNQLTKPGVELTGTTAIVAGAGRGFGRAIAATLSAAGADVVGVARGGAQLDQLRDELGDTFTPVTADATDPTAAAQLCVRSAAVDTGGQHRDHGSYLLTTAGLSALA